MSSGQQRYFHLLDVLNIFLALEGQTYGQDFYIEMFQLIAQNWHRDVVLQKLLQLSFKQIQDL